ncbi:hypothetical protein F1643_04425 [Azospirillum sp. INR13]|uniref:hypothetical protein n=1 Tax=Azospirillum sp. INR13 TaxID=2596919 RepID=UPI0018920924|nr:hypothetical protein [Azospirillum sp. INR13]MBF5093845.1 hypothetical protein [Azospirillum sp. INR13]
MASNRAPTSPLSRMRTRRASNRPEAPWRHTSVALLIASPTRHWKKKAASVAAPAGSVTTAIGGAAPPVAASHRADPNSRAAEPAVRMPDL